MKNFVQRGEVVTLPAPYNVTSGDGMLVGNIFGVATHSALSGAPVETNLVGAVDIKKAASQAWAIGDPIYWDPTGKVATKTLLADARLIGEVLVAVGSGSGETVGRVLLREGHTSGRQVFTFTAPYDVAAGAGFLVGATFAVAAAAALSGAAVVGYLDGTHDLVKAGSQAWTVGAAIYWDNSAKACTTTASGNTKIGFAAAAVGSGAGETTGRVRLNGTV